MEEEMTRQWIRYIQYLKNWIDDHKDLVYCGMSPACFDEWCDNEYDEEDKDPLVPCLEPLPYDEEIETKWSNSEFARTEYMKYIKCFYENERYNMPCASNSPIEYQDFISYSRRWDYGNKGVGKGEENGTDQIHS